MSQYMILLLCSALMVLVVLLAVYMMLRYFAKQNERQFDFLKSNLDLTRLKLEADRSKEREKVLIPLRMQAYERLVLFLERISLPNLLTREMKPKASLVALQSALLSAIREEYEHNLSQQLYISQNSWDMVKAAKEEVVVLIKESAEKVGEKADGLALANELLATTINNSTIEKAIRALKKDMSKNA